MPNIYADLRGFKQRLIQSPKLSYEFTEDDLGYDGSDGDTLDEIQEAELEREELYLEYLEQASRDIDNFVGGGERWRHFYVEHGTRLFIIDDDGRYIFRYPIRGYSFPAQSFDPWTPIFRGGERSLIIPDLLESVDDIPQIDLQERLLGRDTFDLYPLNSSPKISLRFREAIFIRRSRIEIHGKWGYSDERRAFKARLRSNLGEGESVTSMDVELVGSRATKDLPTMGQTIWIGRGEGEEQVQIESHPTAIEGSDPPAYTYTIRRAVNFVPPNQGLTESDYTRRGAASEHQMGATLYYQRYPMPIRQSCIDLALRKYRGREVEWEGPGAEVEGLVDILSPIAAQLVHYRRVEWKIERL